MKCVIPRHSGFCFGVRLAVDAAYDNAGTGAYMYGEVVHNPAVVADLQAKGLPVIHGLCELPDEPGAKVLIRAHGVSKAEMDAIGARGAEIIDKTCPKVKAIHNIVASASERGMDLIVVGMASHPEALGIKGWCGTRVFVLEDLEAAKRATQGAGFSPQGVCMVAQTTYNEQKYLEIYEYCAGVIPNIEFHNTICDETARRQNEVRELAKTADMVIIVGGRGSSNVAKLSEIAAEHCDMALQVESAGEIDFSRLEGVGVLVVASGASTPVDNVDEVLAAVGEWCFNAGVGFELERL